MKSNASLFQLVYKVHLYSAICLTPDWNKQLFNFPAFGNTGYTPGVSRIKWINVPEFHLTLTLGAWLNPLLILALFTCSFIAFKNIFYFISFELEKEENTGTKTDIIC